MDAMIEVRGLAKQFGGARPVTALDRLDLTIPRGEIFGLLGRNGAGKTTLVKILLNIVRPSSGEAQVLGQRPGNVAVRQRIGYLPEDHRFPDYQSAEGALRFHGRLAGLDGGTIRRRTDELLELVELSDARKARVRSFSKGMKQRLGLAQALIHEPELLFLDEPTDGVDPVGRAKIREVLLRLKEQGKSILLNSHLLGEVERICDRVAIMDRGRLARIGTLEELTRTQGSWRLTLDQAPDGALLVALRALDPALKAEGKSLELHLEDDAQIDAVVDRVREAGRGLRHLETRSDTLEEVFIQALQSGGFDA